MSDDVRVIHQ